ncbi:hypothetical protein EVAR_34599_1 [Eumeta japonica]|uniref:Uncharacterized protein n=1 Tax=Eumeta variegata TaxID=151549 RepID=A0A4C1VI26_EUMVA|nr:hypothetical protein EVAR_34599_1 [Eumeta japonica]
MDGSGLEVQVGTAKKEKAFRSAISTAKTRKRCTEKKLEGSLEKFLSKPENRETECQENVGVASTSAALNLEVMEVSEERNISPLEEDFSKTRETTAEEPNVIYCRVAEYDIRAKERKRDRNALIQFKYYAKERARCT